MASERAAEAARRGKCGRDLLKLGATGLAVERRRGTFLLVAIFRKKPKKQVPTSCKVRIKTGTVVRLIKVRITKRIEDIQPEPLPAPP